VSVSRYFRTAFAIFSIVAAGAMLFVATNLIRKNSPKQVAAEVRYSPPTRPSPGASSSDSDSKSFIGGVGIVEPFGETVVIGSERSGVVEEIKVQPGDFVEKGAVLLRLDQRSAFADVEVAKSELLAQECRLAELKAQVANQKARYEAAQAVVEQTTLAESNAKEEFERAMAVFNKQVLSEEEVDNRRLLWEVAKRRSSESRAMLMEAKASLDLLAGEPIAPTIEVQKAAIAQAQAMLFKAQTDLELRSIKAPISGSILSVKIRVGEFVAASVVATPFIAMGVIDPLTVRVDIDESEIPRFHAGLKAYASLRGQPDVRVPLEYLRTEPLVIPKRSLTGTVIERVDTRVLQVIYSVSPTVLKAVVGQQVDVYIEEDATTKQAPVMGT
jgi:multidrug resistance efflux pump